MRNKTLTERITEATNKHLALMESLYSVNADEETLNRLMTQAKEIFQDELDLICMLSERSEGPKITIDQQGILVPEFMEPKTVLLGQPNLDKPRF